MALPCPGPSPISLLDIQNEFGGANPTGINEYYRGGVYVPNTTTNVNIPTSGIISFDKFFCSSTVPPEFVIFITTNTPNLDVRALFEATYPGSWTSTASKRLVINSGVIVYNTNPLAISNLNGYAIRIYDTFNGTFILQNFGSIQAAAGRRGGDSIVSGERRTNQCNGGDGGNAIYIGPAIYGATANSRTVFIENRGTIYAAGGGGGRGGDGCSGQTGTFSNVVTFRGVTSGVTFNITNAGSPGIGGFGGWGEGYGQDRGGTVEVGSPGTAGSGRKSMSFNVLGSGPPFGIVQLSEVRIPPNSDVTFTFSGASVGDLNFSSGNNFTLNAFARTLTQTIFAGGTGSNINLKNNNSTINFLFKSPSQGYNYIAENGSPGLNVQNTSPANQSDGSVSFRAGASGFIFVTTASADGGGQGGVGARRGFDGGQGGSGTCFFGCPGGFQGYSVVGTKYVSYIVTGTVVGRTQS